MHKSRQILFLSFGLSLLFISNVSFATVSLHEKLKALRSTQSSVSLDSRLYLEDTLRQYRVKQKREVVAPLREMIGDRKINKEILFITQRASFSASISQSIFFITRALALHTDIENLGLERGSDCLLNDSLLVDITVQTCGVLIEEIRHQLLVTLDQINVALMYWKEQKNHPAKYFLHKSPVKWVAGMPQEREVSRNIRSLEMMESYIYVLLGKMTQQIYNFDACFTSQQTQHWLEEMMDIIAPLGFYKDNDMENSVSQELAKKVRFQLGSVTKIHKRLFHKISFAQMPGHFVRNWMYYVVFAAGSYKVYEYCNSNPEQMYNALMSTLNTTEWAWHQIVDPVKDGWDTIFGKSIKMSAVEEQAEAQELVKIAQNGIEAAKNSEIVLEAIDNLGPDSMCEVATKQLYNLLSSNGYSDHDIEQIVKSLLSKSDKVLYVSPNNVEVLSKLSAKYHPIFSLQLWILQNKLPYAPLLDSLFPMIGNISSMGSSLATLFSIYAPRFTKAMEQIALTSKLIAFIPATGIAAGTHALYKKLTAKDYSPIRLGLVDANALFIEGEGQLNEYQYGKLLYLLYSLKVKAMTVLPARNNVRADFLLDIAKLESQHFSVDAKRKFVKNMFNKYEFLAV